MPKSKSTVTRVVSTAKPVRDSKARFGFNVTKDIKLLTVALGLNPWQLGQDKWSEVANSLNSEEGFSVTSRSVKERVDLLVRKLKKEELSTKTGTEEEQSQRGELLQNVIAIQEEVAALINVQHGAEDVTITSDIEFEETIGLELPACEDVGISSPAPAPVKSKSTVLKRNKEERVQADQEREDAFSNMFKDRAPEPSSSRSKRLRMSIEEEMIKSRQDHEIMMDSMRFNFEEEKHKSSFAIESQKLELELKKEERRAEESRRNYELSMAQVQFQQTMCQLLKDVSGVVTKNN